MPLEDETYRTLLRLEAEGFLGSSVLSIKPLSKKEIADMVRQAEEDPRSKSPFVKSVIASLKKKRFTSKTGGSVYIETNYSSGNDNLFSYNNSPYDMMKRERNNPFASNKDGTVYSKGVSMRAGADVWADFGAFGFYLNPEADSSGEGGFIRRGYVSAEAFGVGLRAGSDSRWWGGGMNGSTLLSNNARPIPMIELYSDGAFTLPSVLKYIGPIKFDIFVSRLEEDRTIPKPILWGMRVSFKPVKYIEIGAERTVLLGGRGRDESIDTWVESFTGANEHYGGKSPGDQKAGFDVRFILPFEAQPLQIYYGMDGEDSVGIMPVKWAYLGGVYLPRLLAVEPLELRIEYFSSYVSKRPDSWYNHFVYKDGYTYYGRVIGHYISTDSSGLHLQTDYLIPEKNGRVWLAFDREVHAMSHVSKPVLWGMGTGMKCDISEEYGIEAWASGGVVQTHDKSDKGSILLAFKVNYYF